MNVHRIRGTRVSNHARVHFRFDEACDATLLINNAIYPGQESGIAAYFSSRSISSQPVRATWMIQMIKKKRDSNSSDAFDAQRLFFMVRAKLFSLLLHRNRRNGEKEMRGLVVEGRCSKVVRTLRYNFLD